MHRIALRSLFFDRGRLVAALTGVAFATLLMLVQVGIYYGFGDNASALVRHVGGDVWVMSRGTRHVDQGDALSGGIGARLRRDPCVTRVRPLIVSWTPFRKASGAVDSLQLVGVDPGPGEEVPWSTARGLPRDLAAPGRISIDVVDAAIVDSPAGPLGAPLEIGGQTVHVAALTRGIRNIGLNPVVFSSVRTARHLMGLSDGEATFWIADLADSRCAPSVVAAVERDPRLTAMSAADFAASTERELLETSGIGTVLGFIALLGWLVAVVIVGQTLLASMRQHRRELAMLKALGARTSELLGFVAWQAAFLAIVGSAVGTLLAFVVRHLLTSFAISVVLPPSAVLTGVLSILGLCALASAGSVRVIARLEALEVLE